MGGPDNGGCRTEFHEFRLDGQIVHEGLTTFAIRSKFLMEFSAIDPVLFFWRVPI